MPRSAEKIIAEKIIDKSLTREQWQHWLYGDSTEPTVTPRFGPMPNESQAPPFLLWSVARKDGRLYVRWDLEHGYVPRIFRSRRKAREFARQAPGCNAIRVRIELESGGAK